MVHDARTRPHQIRPTDADGVAVATDRPYGLQVIKGGPFGTEVDGLVPVVGGLTSADSSVTLTDNGDGIVDLSAPGGGGAGGSFVGVKVYRSATYALANNAVTAVPWDAEEFDTNTFHDTATNNTRLTVPSGQSGKYQISVNLGTDAAGSITRFLLSVRLNGTTVVRGGIMETSNSGTVFPMNTVSLLASLVAGDYIEATYYQNSGTTKNMFVSECAFSMYKVG